MSALSFLSPHLKTTNVKTAEPTARPPCRRSSPSEERDDPGFGFSSCGETLVWERSPPRLHSSRPLTFQQLLTVPTGAKTGPPPPTPPPPPPPGVGPELPGAVNSSFSLSRGSTLPAARAVRGLNVSPGMSMRRKLLQNKRKLTRGLTCDNIIFRPPPDISVSAS